MTTVVAIEKNRSVEFFSDSQVTSNGSFASGQCVKVFTRGDVTFGMSGTVRGNNILSSMPEIFVPEDEDDLERWLSNTLVPLLSDRFKDHNFAKTSEGVITQKESTIIAVQGRAFYLGGDFGWWSSSDGLYSVGSGSEFALGALYAGASGVEAIEVAAQLDCYSGLPVVTY